MLKSKHSNLIIIVLLALGFFFATASFSYYLQSPNYTKWSSPDEAANYFFTKKFSQSGQLSFFDSADIVGDNIVIPRSVRSDKGSLKPVSFLGIILIYGQLASVLGVGIIPFLTPFFAACGLILFYLILKRLFSKRVALWSSFLLATFPVYIYYTVRGMFHNILFIVLLLFSVYLFILSLGQKNKDKIKFLTLSLSSKQCWEFLGIFLSGLFFGLAIITRSSELLWLIPAIIIIYLFYARRLGLTKPILFVSGLFLALIPAAYYNQILYNYFWYGGYNAMNSSLANIAVSGGKIWEFTWLGQFKYYNYYLEQIFNSVFYFGFNLHQSLSMFKHYVVEMFPVIFYGGALGFLLLIGRKYRSRSQQKKYLVYLLVWLLISGILVFYYGSWKFNDNPDLTQFTIGNSYTRYWLPLYLGLIPLASLALVRFTTAIFFKLKTKLQIKKFVILATQIVVILIIGTSSIIFVLYGSSEGLMCSAYNYLAEKRNTEQVWSLTNPESIIITRYNDKYFWPERRVIVGTLPDKLILQETVKLLEYYPVFYYNFYLNPADVDYLNSRKLSPYNLHLKIIKKINLKFALYQININDNYEELIKE
jgi:4-amino-4-deoxy-L-arabinose transferase-like glycosyltransferase